MASNTHDIVMNRVRTMHRLRPLLSGTVFAGLLSLGSLYAIGREVWVSHVLANFTNVLANGDVARFLFAAFFNTTLIVQILCVATVFGFVWLARDFARSLPTLQLA